MPTPQLPTIGGGVANTGGESPADVIPCVQVTDVADTCTLRCVVPPTSA